MSTRESPWTWPISLRPRQYSVPPKRCGDEVTPDRACMATSIVSAALATGISASWESCWLLLDGYGGFCVMGCRGGPRSTNWRSGAFHCGLARGRQRKRQRPELEFDRARLRGYLGAQFILAHI